MNRGEIKEGSSIGCCNKLSEIFTGSLTFNLNHKPR